MALFQTYAKFVVAGEHAVLRKASALAFPLKTLTFKLHFTQGSKELKAQNIKYQYQHIGDDFLQLEGSDFKAYSSPIKGASSLQSAAPKVSQKKAHQVFYEVLQHTLQLVGRKQSDLKGECKIENQIPVGCGLGASAACSLALAYLCESQGWLQPQHIFKLARGVENFFHNQSSGLDVATLMHQTPVLYSAAKGVQAIQPAWWPRFKLSYSGQQSRTDKNIKKVHTWRQQNPGQAEYVDQQMHASTQLACQALQNPQIQQKQLAQALQQAHNCFKTWGLVTTKMQQHSECLLKQGALAVKATGSGGGGYMLSLWPHN